MEPARGVKRTRDEEIRDLSVNGLREVLSARGLPTKGSKGELGFRLRQAQDAETPDKRGPRADVLTDEEKARLLQNVFANAQEMQDGQRANRAVWTAATFAGLATCSISLFTGMKGNTIDAALREYPIPFASDFFQVKAVHGVPRPRGEDEYSDAESWLRLKCAASKSGDKQEVFRSPRSRHYMWCEYIKDNGRAGALLFANAWKDFHVQVAPHTEFDRFSCTRCQGWSARIVTLEARLAVTTGPGRDEIESELISLQVMLFLLPLCHLTV